MTSEFKSVVVSGLTYLLLAIIVVGGLLLAYPHYARAKAVQQQNEELRQKIEQRKRDIAQLKENQRRFHSDSDFIELIARQNHRVLPGELIFVFEKN